MLIIILLVLAAVFTLLPGLILFVSIVWIHRPDLSLIDILREVIKEIKNAIAETQSLSGKGEIQNEQDYHL